MLELKLIEQPEIWEQFVLERPNTLFTQSALNRHVYCGAGEQALIFGLYRDGKLIGGTLAIDIAAKRGRFLALLYGPLLDFDNPEEVSFFFAELKKQAGERGIDFIRVSPYLTDAPETKGLFHKLNLRPSPLHIIAEHTWLLDLADNEKTILGNMKKNHRNLINRCERAGVHISTHTDQAALDRLNDMHDVVSRRHSFHRFKRSFIEREFKAFAEQGQALIFEARLPSGEIDASAIIIFYNTMACYRHSASLNLDKRLPSSYLLQWYAIREAKKRGMKLYNFWGIEPPDADKNHPFAGIGHFKRGFGGYGQTLIACHDLPITKTYWFTYIIESIRSKWRGFS